MEDLKMESVERQLDALKKQDRAEIVKSFYEKSDEGKRLERSRQGQLEYFITMNYIHRFAMAGCRILEIAEAKPDFSMTDEDFKAFADYQLHICEKREMLGNSSHLLYICRKR